MAEIRRKIMFHFGASVFPIFLVLVFESILANYGILISLHPFSGWIARHSDDLDQRRGGSAKERTV